jgi:glycosyltransferase involved in cell wall biosynthesis
MAQKATIFKADLAVADMDRNHFATHALTLARHPSETDERMMVRLLAFALNADDALAFGRGLSSEDEADLALRDLTGAVQLWIDVGLPDERFLFLFSFDFNSFIVRKNPEACIAAFRQAFGSTRRDVGLVIKSINGPRQPEKLRAMRELIGGDDRIVIVDGFFSRDQVSGLQSVADAYVSLHRAEGLGLGLAESMYQGKPVIGTRYSGNLEFMDDDNSCLVDCTLVPVRKGEYLYYDERFRWADPDVEHAAHWMRRLVDDAGFRMRIAARGQHDIRTRFTPANAAALMRRRLSELGLPAPATAAAATATATARD